VRVARICLRIGAWVDDGYWYEVEQSLIGALFWGRTQQPANCKRGLQFLRWRLYTDMNMRQMICGFL